MAGPLTGIRVLDLSRVLAGPWAGQVLADLGADVIKVERKGVGDDTRSWGPPYLDDAENGKSRESGYYLSANRGKRSIEIDFNDPADIATVKTLAARSDVVLENFKVGTLDRYGLGYNDLAADNPGLLYCSVTGFGLTGPRKAQVAYDFMIQGMGGLMSVTGESDERGGGPQKVGVPIIDLMTGMYAAVAVLGGLVGRAKTGKGDHIDVAMLDVSVAMLANQAMNYLVSQKDPVRRGNRHPNIQPQDVFAVRDGHIVLAVGNDEQFRRFAEAVGNPELASDERYATNAARVQNLDSLHPLVSEMLLQRDLDDWLARLEEFGIPCGPINEVSRVFREEQVVHREMLKTFTDTAGRDVPQVLSPMKFAHHSLEFERLPPRLGEHTAEILKEIGD
ncbi:CaiB/BaiF CoA-transferase family protein [Devosia ginsengisoli]|uniref:CaiB/BaiF CoA transferase family protein n=1 Tax=Devosia ginsengisoli TaxID=400770 RepID=UPI0026EF2BA7|nr:CaiB/BaiF CoA-transferase family protein [Devosia ginsengisoli]MCR6671424.1 CoA transferase [Devosia ginsengisoli]